MALKVLVRGASGAVREVVLQPGQTLALQPGEQLLIPRELVRETTATEIVLADPADPTGETWRIQIPDGAELLAGPRPTLDYIPVAGETLPPPEAAATGAGGGGFFAAPEFLILSGLAGVGLIIGLSGGGGGGGGSGNNTAPVISGGDTAAVTVPENTTTVATIAATDAQAGSSLSYSISGGADAARFTIDATTGALRFATAPNFETPTDANGDNIYDVIVQVSDGSLTDTQTVRVTVTNANEAPVVMDQSFTAAENAAVGSVIGSVASSDVDAGDTRSYSIVGGNTNGAFAIDPVTGEIRIANAAALDFETTPSLTLTVGVTDAGGLFDSATVTITLTNVNEAPVVADQSFSTPENRANGTVVGTVASSDPDASDTRSYSITGGNTNGAFAIDAVTGELRVANAAALNFETTPSFTLTVGVTDAGGLSDTATVTVQLTNVNEAPVFDDQHFNLGETTPNGTVIGSVFGVDPDAGDTLTFSLLEDNAGGAFTLDTATGRITLIDNSLIDFETPASLGLTVGITDAAGLSDTAVITLNIGAENEAPTLDNQTFSVDENSAAGTLVGRLVTRDPDVGDTQAYSLLGGSGSGLFTLDADTGEIRIATGISLDFEALSNYSLQIGVTDAEGLSDSATITVGINDVNEAPTLISYGGADSVQLQAAEGYGQTVGQFTATDPDAGSVLRYSIVGGSDRNQFSIDEQTGELRFNTALDFERPADADRDNQYDLVVQVSDGGGLTDTQAVRLIVTNVNEAPVITSDGGGTAAVVTVQENTTAVTIIAALDPEGDSLSYRIIGGADAARFAIDSVTGALRFVTAPDVEQPLDAGGNNVYDVIVETSDGSLTDSQLLAVTVTNQNEAPVVADQSFLTPENRTAGTVIGTVASSDPDVSDTRSYSLLGGNTNGAFAIDAVTGEIRVANAAALNFEATPSFTLTVGVTDAGGLSDTATVTVTLTNVNEAPVIEDAARSVAENSSVGTLVGDVIPSSDPDANDTRSYSIIGGNTNGAFAIDAQTGQLRVATLGALDFETSPSFTLTLGVTDAGGLSDTATVTVNLTNVNEAPVIEDATRSVAENSSAGTLVGDVIPSSDPDANDTRSYSIIGGNINGAFAIDMVTGELRVANAAALNFETTPSFTLTLGVTDAGGLSDTATVTVTLTNVNEAPVIDDATRSVAENSSAGTLVGAVIPSSDPDAGDTRSYSLIGGNTGGAFAIDAQTGQLRVATPGALDFETSPSFTLTLGVTDAGGLSDTATVTVNLTNVNEAPVITSNGGGNTAIVSVAENSSAVTTVVATDVDAGTMLTYSLAGGADQARFAINSSTGALSFIAPPDFENPTDSGSNNIYDVIVQVSDGTLTDTQSLSITVTDVNENLNAPVITSNGGGDSAAISLAENGTAVTAVVATDADLVGTLTYSLAGGADQARFAINSSTGALSLIAPPDFENPTDSGTNNVYDVIVRVSDGLFSDTQALAVTVTNVNDNAPVITSNGGGNTASVSVAENSSAVTTVTATDLDVPSTLTYSLIGGADQARFAINSSTGALTFVTPPNFESPTDSGGNNVYDVVVQVSDGSLTDSQALAVTVTNLNDNTPVITSNGGGDSAAISIAENGTAVTTVVATDADTGATLTYSLIGGTDQARFAINSSTGALSFIAPPDFENPTDNGTNNVYNVVVQVSDGTFSDTQAVAVTVTDLTDNAPVITSNGGGDSAAISFSENGTAVATVVATDADAGAMLTYSLAGGADQARFSIHTGTGALSFIAPPDFETPTDNGTNNVYNVIVRVSDGTFSDTQALAVTVTNVNETPVITSNGGGNTASVSVAENSSAVTTVTAADPDVPSTLTYSLIGGADQARFAINSSTGALTFVSSPNFESPADSGGNNIYDVVVQVSDGSLTDSQALAVTVTNVNEAPVITSNGAGNTASVSVAENSSAVTTVTATDPDVPSTLTYSLIGGADQARFAINSSTGALTFVTPPNFESPTDSGTDNVYNVTVQVSDGSLTDSQAIAVTVTNINDNTPVITSNGGGDSAAISIAENGTAVTTVVATDADAGTTLTYSLAGGADQLLFAINSSTGALSFIAPPDFENPTDSGTNNVYNVVVQVSDGMFSDTQALAITITDATDNAPVITSNGGGDSAAISIAENSTAVTTVVATDADAGATLTYSLAGGLDQARFSINTSTGALSFVAPPDFETPTDSGTNNVYNVIVRVSDGSFSDTQALAVTVTNVNEAPVINSNGGGNTASVSVAENSSAVTTVTATDPDVPSTLTYSLIGGADQARFAINSSTGALTFVTAPNFESPTDSGGNNIYDVVVQVSDGSLTDSQALTVTVTNVNEAPVINSNGGGNTASVSVAENSSAVTTVTATDPDVPSTLTYSLIGGADQARFAINSSTGALSFIAPPNFESPTESGTDNVYNVTVQVSDGSLTDTQAIAVTVTNVNEAPVINSNGGGNTASVSVAENSSAVTTVTATDPDVPSTLTYSLIGGADQARFAINSSTGALTFVTAPNFESPTDSGGNNIYDVVVQVSDGSLTDSQALAVTVTNVNEAPVITSNGGGSTASVSVVENSSAVTTVTATDPDVPSMLTFSLIGGADQARFAINSSTGALTFITPPNFESPTDSGGNNIYDVVVQVSDGSLTDSQAIAVTVTDVNDNAPVITSNGGGDTASVSVAENTTAVTMVVATDVDGPSLSYSLVAGGDAALFSISSSTGALSFNTAPDFEMPADGNGDNAYNVTVRVSDGSLSDTQAITITVTDVNEAISVLALSALDGFNGFRLDGVAEYTYSATSVSSAGDVNGDGFDDLIIGAPAADPNGINSGSSYVVFGQASGFASSINLSTLDGITGFRLDGVTIQDQIGRSVSSAGDVNGDGYDDLIIGANSADVSGITGAGSSYVVFGRASGFASTFNLSTLDGTNGFRLDGVELGSQSGISVSGAGDVNGDGFDDLIIGASGANFGPPFFNGSYVVFGQASGFASSINLSSLNGSTGFRLDGGMQVERIGLSVSSAGDVNGDGYDDLIVGAPGPSFGGTSTGSSYIVFGQASAFASSITLNALDGTNGFRLDGASANDFSGFSVSSAGDVNGDGFGDLIIGSPGADLNGNLSGSSYVLFGRASGFASAFNLNALDGTNGFRLDGVTTGDESGYSVSSAGDVNGDGYDDLIVGASRADPNGLYSGSSYVVFGRASGFASSINLSTLDGSTGFRLDGVTTNDSSGISVSGAGDVDGDGFDDLIVGARRADPNGGESGSSYVIYGFATTGGNIDVVGSSADNTTTLTALQKGVDGGAGNDSLTGNASANTLIGGQGNDTLNGAGGNDVLIGGVGNDVLVYDAADMLRVDGGTGRDTLRIDGSGVNLNLTALNNFSTPATAPANPYSNIEIINLTGSGNNTLTLNAADLLRLVDAAGPQADRQQNLLRVDGNAGDAVVAAGIWLNQGARDADGNAGTGYTLYTSGSAQLLVQNGVSQAGITQNQAPVITSNGGGDTASVSVAENTTAVTTVIATDVDGPSLSYSLVAGGDAALFSINSSTGALSFNTAPDFEMPTDGNGNNAYNVTVRVSDGNLSDTQAITVTVTDVNEAISVLALSALNGTNGFRLDGVTTGDNSGLSVASAGDVNGDGYDDLIVGARFADPNGNASGSSYVVFGRASGFDSTLNLSALDGGNGFRLDGVAGSESGISVASAGDVNGDGYDDLIIGAYAASFSHQYSGSSYVVFGRASGFASSINLSTLDGSTGFRLDGAAAVDYSGSSVSSAGDVNGDGYDDLIIGATGADLNGGSSGSSYVVFGRASGFASTSTLNTLDGTNGFRLDGVTTNDTSGSSVSSAGDVNGDGYDDLIIGARAADPNGGGSGSSYVVFGRASGFASSINLSTLDGSTGFRLDGVTANDVSGSSVASAGDVNGDGYDDLIVGASQADPNGGGSGSSYVVFGRASGFASSVNLSTLNGSTGFRLDGVTMNDRSGISVASAGDVNGDGYDDLIVGASQADPNGPDSGSSYVVFGRASGFASSVNLSTLNGSTGFRLDGVTMNDRSGISVASAGDVNGDGYDDLIIGAGGADPSGVQDAGSSYVVYGFATAVGNIDVVGSSADNTTTLTALQRGVDGGAGNDSLTGNASANTLIGGQGNDTLNGAGGNDVLIGGVGNDVLVYDAADTLRVDGGTGRDTLRIDGSGVNLNLTTLNNFSTPATAPANPYSNIEIIDLTGSGNNTLTLNAADLLGLVDAATDVGGGRDQNLLRVDGNAGDAVVAAGIWTELGRADVSGSLSGSGVYTLYQSGAAHLLVRNTIDQSGIATPVDTVALSALDGADGFRINGELANGFAGRSVSSAGDINGDGYDDVIVGATRASANGAASGASYVVFGRASGLPSTVEVSTLNGADGFKIHGEGIGHYAGVVAAAGDVNGDGYDDVLIAASGVDVNGTNSGAAYVVFGKASGFTSVISLSSLAGSNGFQINGEALGDQLGSVAGAGDLNGDGYDDLLIGAQFSDVGGGDSGVSYVVFGRNGGFSSELNLSSLDGVNGFQINFQGAGGSFGRSLSSAGDVNGDGIDDLIIGADHADVNGASFIVFGRNGGFGSVLEVSALDGITGFKIVGAEAGDQAGSVASAGDVNGDGYDDLIIGADGAAPNTPYSGASYVVFGRATGFGSAINLSTLNGSTGFRLNGIDNGDLSGFSVSAAGDVNGDGYADVLIGAADGDPNGLSSGESYVVFGRAGGFASEMDLSSLNGVNGFVINGEAAGDRSGNKVSAAGDVNGDGFDDLIIGAHTASPGGRSEAGAAHVVFGFATLGGAIDVVGSSADNTTTLTTLQKGVDGGAGNDSLTGNASANTLIGGQGNDTLNGAGGNDVLIGGAGNDVLVYDPADTLRVDGGSGRDTLRIDGSGVNLNLTALNNFSTPATPPANPYSNIEIIDLTGSGNNTLTLNAADLLRLVDAATDGSGGRDQNLLRVDGNAGDAVVTSSGLWANAGARNAHGNAGTGYTLYTSGTAQLLVQNGVDQSGIAVPVSSLSMTTLNGSNGYRLLGEATYANTGHSVSGAGDVNGDGFDDVIIGARYGDSNGVNSGTSYVIYGAAGGMSASQGLGSSGVRIAGPAANAGAGWSVSGAGDVNNDGFADVVMGAPFTTLTTPANAFGGSFVVFGGSALPANISLNGLTGSNGFRVTAPAGSFPGRSVSDAGDVNGDGYADVLISAERFAANGLSGSGSAFVVYGRPGAFTADINLTTMNAASGFQIAGEMENDEIGRVVSSIGDFNGDGFDDLIIANYQLSRGVTTQIGGNYVVFGGSGLTSSVNLSALNGSNGFRIFGTTGSEQLGSSVSGVGDLNGDGFADFIVAQGFSGTGLSYVVFGRSGAMPGTLQLSTLNGSNGFVLSPPSNNRFDVSGAGDINGDGYDDLILTTNIGGGSSYVLFGRAGGFTSNIDLSSLGGATGFRLTDTEQAVTASAAGDMNGDGFDDVILGAPFTGSNSGTAFVVHGFATAGTMSQVGTGGNDTLVAGTADTGLNGGAGNDSLTGNASANTLIGGLGNDTLNGGGGNDVLIGAAGDDLLIYDALDVTRVDGGNGTDTLRLQNGDDINFTAIHDLLITGIERIDLETDAGINQLTLAVRDILALSDSTNDLFIFGNTGDIVDLSPGFADTGNFTQDGRTYDLYTIAGNDARVYIEQGLTVI